MGGRPTAGGPALSVAEGTPALYPKNHVGTAALGCPAEQSSAFLRRARKLSSCARPGRPREAAPTWAWVGPSVWFEGEVEHQRNGQQQHHIQDNNQRQVGYGDLWCGRRRWNLWRSHRRNLRHLKVRHLRGLWHRRSMRHWRGVGDLRSGGHMWNLQWGKLELTGPAAGTLL